MKERAHLRVIEAEQRVALDRREQRERRRAGGFFKGKIVIARAIGVRAAGRVENTRGHPFADRGLLVVRVAVELERVSEGEWPDEFRGHAAGEIDDLVVPEIAIEAAVGWAVGVAILER